jgi:beta-glucosidase/6-phospho-beta-glucosidase/beta-galactosidase
MHGKNLRLMGFEGHTSHFLIDMVNEFISLNKYPSIMRKVTQSEKEQMALALISNNYVKIIVEQMDSLEKKGKDFIGLNYFRKRLVDYYQNCATQISDALTDSIDYELLTVYQVPNPNDINHPTRACKLNRENPAVKYILKE